MEKVVFEEDFSLMTKGEVGAPADDIICEDGVIKSEYTHKAGWKATGVKSAGGAVYVPNDDSHTLLSPIVDCSASVDGKVTIEFDAYYIDEAEAGGVFIWTLHPNATSTEANQMVSQLKMNCAETWIHMTYSTDAASKPLNPMNDSKTFQVGIRSTYNAIYVKNLKVTINVDPNAAPVEGTDFTGVWSFKGTKTITASNVEDSWAVWANDEYEFTISKNEGDDAAAFPYILTGFPSFGDGTGAKATSMKAKVSEDGTSLVIPVGHAYQATAGEDHVDVAGPEGLDDTATEIVISPIADSGNYTIVGGFSVTKHSNAQWGGIIPESKRNLAKFTDIVITRVGDVDGIDEIVVDEVEEAEKIAPAGVYTINGVKIRNTNDATDLHPGFYIIGGKKVVIR
ncbi:MAG: hypothetical protein ACI4UL_04800 [Muribaculaceae bacterium]